MAISNGIQSASKGNTQIVLAGASALLSSVTIPPGTTKVLIHPRSADIYITDDGTAATANDYQIKSDTEWLYDSDKIEAVRLFGTATVDLWFLA